MTRLTLLLLSLWVGNSAAACIPVKRDVVTAADLTEAIPALARIEPNTRLMFAPALGIERSIGPRELARVLGKIGTTDGVDKGICVVRFARRLSEEEIRAAIVKSLDADVQVRIYDHSRFAVPEGHLEFPLRGLVGDLTRPQQAVLWRGRVIPESGRPTPVWARVQLAAEREVTLAARDLQPGERVVESDLVREKRTVFPLPRRDSAHAVDVIGRTPRRRVPKGTPIAEGSFVQSRDVEPGEKIDLRIQSGAVTLRIAGEALGGGRRGDQIWVRNRLNGTRLKGKIEGPRLVFVEADGNAKEINDSVDDSGSVRGRTEEGAAARRN